jgi:hypothetical protein
MPAPNAKPSRRVLDPGDRIAEALFGLIMALTFTGSLSVADAGRDDVHAMLIGALGCNLAWGLIDGIFYLFFRMADIGLDRTLLDALHRTPDPVEGRRLVADALPASVVSVLQPDELDGLRSRLSARPTDAVRGRLSREDWLGALAVFLLVFLSTFPLALPFVFMDRVAPAMRVSNAIAIALLAIAGVAYGRHIGRSPLLTATTMVLLGVVLVGITIALGG